MRRYERADVTIDQCTEYRGIFLDRGESERLVDAEASWHGSGAQQPYQQQRPHGRYRDYDSDEYPVYGHGHKRKKHRGFLGELFD